MFLLECENYISGDIWIVRCPILEISGIGPKNEAMQMLKSAIETAANAPGFCVTLQPPCGFPTEVASNDDAILLGLVLKRQRQKKKLTLLEVAKRMGQRSKNTLLRYERGRSLPTIRQMEKLFNAIGIDHSLTIRITPKPEPQAT